MNNGKPITLNVLEKKLKEVCKLYRWTYYASSKQRLRRPALTIVQATRGYAIGVCRPGWGESRISGIYKGRELFLMLEGLLFKAEITPLYK